MKFTVKGSLDKILKDLKRFEPKNAGVVNAKALNKTAFEVRDALKREMQSAFSNPRPFTINSLYVKKATPSNLTAYVGIKDENALAKGTPAAKYLAPQINGGGRVHKRFEKWLIYHGVMPSGKYAIPGRDVKLDRYGNPSAGLYTQILSALGASSDPMQNQTMRSKAKAKRTGAYRIFVVQRGNTAIGIGRSRGKGGRLEMLFFFGRQPQYVKRFFFYETAQRVARQQLPLKLDEVWAKEMARG